MLLTISIALLFIAGAGLVFPFRTLEGKTPTPNKGLESASLQVQDNSGSELIDAYKQWTRVNLLSFTRA